MEINQKGPATVIIAFIFSLLIPAIGFYYLGLLYAMLFLIGYMGGFLLWLLVSSHTPWTSLKKPYWLTILAFLFLHKVEENRMKFFEVVSEKITGGTVPEYSVGLIIGMLILPIGAWLIAPWLIKRGQELGYFAIWTLFVSMGITELAHFFLPFMIHEPYGYFPGMASVIVLAPLAWWGLYKLSRKDNKGALQATPLN